MDPITNEKETASTDETSLEPILARLEALLFTYSEPVATDKLIEHLSPQAPELTHEAIEQLAARLQASDRGLRLDEIAGGWRLGTKAELDPFLRSFHETVKRGRHVSSDAP